MILLAHGALGQWDEIVFIGVVVLFVIMMVISWIRSGGIESEPLEEIEKPKNADSSDRFRLD